LAIQSAKSIGCVVVNIKPNLITDKREHIILGLTW
jgi:plastin-1